MSTIINKDIPYKILLDELLDEVKVDRDYNDIKLIKDYLKKANQIGQPKAIYKEVFIKEQREDYVICGQQRFESKILSINLKDVYKVMVYVVTAGQEIKEWADKQDVDMLETYWLDVLQEIILRKALDYIKREINEKHLPGSSSVMNPGSLNDWPLTEQSKLFKLLGNVKKEIGVSLTNSNLMLPKKSVSGLIFPTEKNFENCQLCPKENCPSRSAPYDPSLLKEKYS
ncbi:MAG: hypothetical protein KGY44_06030 [Halanaerobiales bacterium]|nr:hypothetical protein [Halanaerobiales bacterium]